MSDETGVGAAAAMTSTHQSETDPVEGEKPSTTTQNQSSEVVGNDDGKKGMGAAAGKESAGPVGSGMEAATAWNEGSLFELNIYGEDFQDRIDRLGASRTFAIRRSFVVLHHLKDTEDGSDIPCYVPCGDTRTEVIKWYKNMFEKAGVLVRDVHAFLPEKIKDDEPRFEYELRTSYFRHLGKGWYFTPSLLYKPAYIDLNAPVFNSWLSNGDVVLYTPQGTVHEDGFFDEAANALTFVDAFFQWDRSEMRSQPDVRAVFVRSLSQLKMAAEMAEQRRTGVFKTINQRESFVELDIDIMSWSSKKETELSWQIAL